MREILFRGKSIVANTPNTSGYWMEGNLFHQTRTSYGENVNCYHILDGNKIIEGPDCNSEVWPETVGQFTGILDKNDKKIFEGDIVFVTHLTPNPYWDYTSVIGVVQWTGGAFEVKGVENEDYTPYGWLHDSCRACREIIGNIHDNPELLR